MVRQVATRSQRRMEKKQAVILLAMVLAVSLVSFALGVMVGRAGSRSAVEAPAPPQRLPIAQAVPPPAEAAANGGRSAESLTFYDSLPKGDQPPLGSGINLPPAKEKPEAPTTSAGESGGRPAAEPAAAPSPAPARAAEAPAPVRAAPTTAVSSATSAGVYVVQAAAFRRSEEARGLQQKLAKKGYSAFVEEARLGEKGVWYRVYVGPFAAAGAADVAVSRLKAEERLTALVRKR